GGRSAACRRWAWGSSRSFLVVASIRFLFIAAAKTLRGGPGFGNAVVPVENLRAVPVQHALVPIDVVVDRFEIFDAMRLARNVGMDGERADLGARRAL